MPFLPHSLQQFRNSKRDRRLSSPGSSFSRKTFMTLSSNLLNARSSQSFHSTRSYVRLTECIAFPPNLSSLPHYIVILMVNPSYQKLISQAIDTTFRVHMMSTGTQLNLCDWEFRLCRINISSTGSGTCNHRYPSNQFRGMRLCARGCMGFQRIIKIKSEQTSNTFPFFR